MKYLSFLIILFLTSTEEKAPLGEFYSSNKYDHYKLVLKKNNQFTQQNGSCTWSYLASGKWSANGDTISLIPEKLYNVHGNGRKNLVDTGSYNYDLFYQYNKCFIISQDTIGLFRIDKDKKIKRTIKLHKKN